MSISVEGQKCPVCKGYMFDDDDIVFCPVCGAPSHRECYTAVGHCPLEEYHGTEMEYKPPIAKENAEEIPQQEPQNEPFNPQNKGFENTPFGIRFTQIDLLGGFNPKDQIDGVTAEEMRDVVGANTGYYIPKFFSLNKQKKTSWNWASFLFPHGFFFFRKAVKPGILAFLLQVTATVLLNFPLLYITVTENMDTTAMMNAIQVILNDPQKFFYCFITTVLGVIISLASRIVFGLYGNWIYRNECFDKIKKIKESDEEDKPLLLKLKGGINPFFGLFGIMGVNWLAGILFTFL